VLREGIVSLKQLVERTMKATMDTDKRERDQKEKETARAAAASAAAAPKTTEGGS